MRAARLSDAREIAELSGALGYPSAEGEVRARLQELFTSSDDAVFVAESEAGAADCLVIGWIHVLVARRVESDPFAEIGGLVVEETRRGTGVGIRLLEAAEAWSQDQGCATLRVRSNVVREAAHGFYESKGFARVKCQVVFSKSLEDRRSGSS